MKLIKKIGRISPETKDYYGVFLCPYCNQPTIMPIGNGRRNKSCGCKSIELASLNKTSNHHLSKTKLYDVWAGIIQRCYDEKSPVYKYYGLKGVVLCKEWRHNAPVFVLWALNNGYKEGLQIDRIDNNGNYTPDNCRFVTRKENMRNTSRLKLSIEKVREIRQKYIPFRYTRKELAEEFNCSVGTIKQVISHKTWS